MPTIIDKRDGLSAWQAASQLILKNGPQDNLIITIQQPCDFSDLKQWILERNPKSFGGSDHIRQVINTIMPYGLAAFFNCRHDFYNKYKSVYIAGTNRSWGTYFQRLICFDNHFRTNGPNQLENVIGALNGGSPQKHYINFHLSDISLDNNARPMGAPCWHFGEITVNADRTINLIAVYRAQDYFNKALGNFIGLSKLLEFICLHTNRKPGKLIVHAIYAFRHGSSKKNFAQLIA